MSDNDTPGSRKPKFDKHALGLRRKTKRAAELTTASDVLQGLLQNSKSPIADGFQRWRLERSWPEIVGKTIAEQTMPARFDNGVLFIWVRHSVWMQQLWFFQNEIRDNVNKHLGRQWVKQVKFTLNRGQAESVPPTP